MSSQEPSSRIPGFYKLSVDDRLAKVQEFAGLSDEEVAALRGADPQRLAQADKMIENVGGLFHLPVGFAANFRIDGRDRVLPLVLEEPSVVAASSHAAKLMRSEEGIVTEATEPLMIGQLQLCDVPDVEAGRIALEEQAPRLVAWANEQHPRLVARGGGARSLTVRAFPDSSIGPMLVAHVFVDVCDAMGANLVNGMAEALAPECEELTGGTAQLRILSNLADHRVVRARGHIPTERLARPDQGLTGEEVAERLERASVFAEEDPYRAATHNKGIMNGVDAFLLATGQDWRAVEAGAHAYAALGGAYTALATWRRSEDGVVGELALPVQVGLVGGVTKVHPVVQVLLRVVDAGSATELGRMAAAAGLAQNLAAIQALATEGIQRGHMSLHARNIAAAAGASEDEIDRIVAEMIRRQSVNHAAAQRILEETKTEPTAPEPERHEPMSREEIEAVRDYHWPRIEEVLGEVVGWHDAAAGSFADMVRYQFDTGGKRLRATIPLLVHRAFGADAGRAVPFAAALELLHNATLIHDDAEVRLRTRRGRDTLWVRFGLDQAINCGDGMLYAALECLDRLPQSPEAQRWVERRMVRRMRRVIEAQVEARRREWGPETGLELARDRAGGLFALAIAGSAHLAGADGPTVEQLETLGGHLGVILQVEDELLDLTGGKRGVPRGSAIVDGRTGLLVTHCLETAPEDEAAELQSILRWPPSETRASDIARATELLQAHGSLAWGGELIQENQARVDAIAGELGHPELARLLAGISDVFLAPLLARLEG